MARLSEQCGARIEWPYLDNWTIEEDEFHVAGEFRPLFGIVGFTCQLPHGHDGAHDWPDPKTVTVPKPRRPMEAVYMGPAEGG